jgi:very-short-patch-repair endonuclease
MSWEDLLLERADEQLGLVARFELWDLGLDKHHWQRARRNGRWDALSARVLRRRGSGSSDAQRALAAVLDASPGGFLHGPATLGWFGLRGYDLSRIHVARIRGTSNHVPTLGEFHRLRNVRPHDLLAARGIVTESPLRAIWTEAGRFASPHRFEWGLDKIGHLLDEAHRKHLLTWGALHEMVDEIHQRGLAGTVLMRTLAASRQPGSSPTETRLEDQFEKVLANAGARPFRRQVVVGGHELIGRTDFRDDELPLAVEINSLTFHTEETDRQADLLRYRRLNDTGFTVAVVWEDDLWSRQRAVVETVAEARRLASLRQTVVIHSPGCPWPGPR